MARLALLVLALASSACVMPRHDQPDWLREDTVPLAPAFSLLYDHEVSANGESEEWSALLWLLGGWREGERHGSRALPFWWHDVDPPYSETTVLFPLWFERTTPETTTRWITPLYGYSSTPESRGDWVVLNIFDWQRSRLSDRHRSGLFLVYDWESWGERVDFTLVPIIGMSFHLGHLARFQWGFPPDGERVGALDREGSRRFELVNALGFATLFGYDDVGDRRDIRLGTLLSNEVLSVFRSYRGRGDDPFVREWLFPLYMNMQDADDGWMYVGPLWGSQDDRVAGTHTDWWLLGLLSRQEAPDGVRWSVCGLEIVGP